MVAYSSPGDFRTLLAGAAGPGATGVFALRAGATIRVQSVGVAECRSPEPAVGAR